MAMRVASMPGRAAGLGLLFSACTLMAQTTPIAIVPVEGVKLTGALEIAEGKAVIAASGTVTAGERTATVTLPDRGNLKLCPTTKVSLTADSSVSGMMAAGEAPGLMVALDRGAVEAAFATGKNSDVILTPDFRILISGPGTASVQVRLGAKGDTCVDNRGPNAAYVTVSSIFDGGIYRVQADQRVMFQHGSLREVVDQEKESCGCPNEPAEPTEPTGMKTTSSDPFPLAQSEGLAPLSASPPNATEKGKVNAQITAQLTYDAKAAAAAPTGPPVTASQPATEGPLSGQLPEQASVKPAPKATAKPEEKPGFFHSLGHFFRKLFGG